MTRSFLSPSDFSTFDAITKQVPKTHSRPTHLLCSWGEPAANQQRGHSAGAARTRSSRTWSRSRRLRPSPGRRLGREAPKMPPPYSLLFLSNALLLGPLLPSSHSFAPGPSRSHWLRAQPALPCAPHTAARDALRAPPTRPPRGPTRLHLLLAARRPGSWMCPQVIGEPGPAASPIRRSSSTRGLGGGGPERRPSFSRGHQERLPVFSLYSSLKTRRARLPQGARGLAPPAARSPFRALGTRAAPPAVTAP